MDCIFCEIMSNTIPSKTLYEDNIVKVIMDANPATDGHALIIPKKHIEDYLNVDNETLNHMFEIAQKIGPEMIEKLNVDSLSLLINYGDDQKVKHLHLHLIPNYIKGYHSGGAKKSIEDNFKILTK